MTIKTNQDIRLEARGTGIPLYAIAEALCMSQANFFIKLRRELSNEDKQKIRDVIKKLSKREE